MCESANVCLSQKERKIWFSLALRKWVQLKSDRKPNMFGLFSRWLSNGQAATATATTEDSSASIETSTTTSETTTIATTEFASVPSNNININNSDCNNSPPSELAPEELLQFTTETTSVPTSSTNSKKKECFSVVDGDVCCVPSTSLATAILSNNDKPDIEANNRSGNSDTLIISNSTLEKSKKTVKITRVMADDHQNNSIAEGTVVKIPNATTTTTITPSQSTSSNSLLTNLLEQFLTNTSSSTNSWCGAILFLAIPVTCILITLVFFEKNKNKAKSKNTLLKTGDGNNTQKGKKKVTIKSDSTSTAEEIISPSRNPCCSTFTTASSSSPPPLPCPSAVQVHYGNWKNTFLQDNKRLSPLLCTVDTFPVYIYPNK